MRNLFVSLLFLILAVVSQAQALEMTFMDPDATDPAGFRYLAIEGELWPDDVAQLKHRLLEQTARGESTVILLSGDGGVLEAVAPFAIALLEASERSFHAVGRPNVVVIDSDCASACTVLTSSLTKMRVKNSLRILVSANSRFLFHSPMERVEESCTSSGSIPSDCGPDGLRVTYREFGVPKRRAQEIAKLRRAYQRAGVSSAWLKKNEKAIRQGAFTTFTGRELCETRAMVVPPTSCLSEKADILKVAVRLATTPAVKKEPKNKTLLDVLRSPILGEKTLK